jgi:formylglycine-generating enzyme required for sulfatase activity
VLERAATSTSDATGREPGQPAHTRVFISYSRKDLVFADQLDTGLKARGFEPLIDRDDIYAFEKWWECIEALIAQADTVVFVLSPNSVVSDVALRETAFAASLNKRFAPIVYQRVDDKQVPEALAKLNFIFFDDLARFEQSMDQLAEALNTDIAWIRRHTEFSEAARRWIEANRSSGLLLRPPLLDQAEAWLTYRPGGVPSPTPETEAPIQTSRAAELRARRRSRVLNAALYSMLICIIVGLIDWINQDYLKEQINWYWSVRPYRIANFDPYVLKPDAERALKSGNVFRECAKDCPEMVVIPEGSFMMGSATNEKGRYSNEGPQHKVTIAKPFAVSKFDFADWDACWSVGGCPQISDSGYGRGSKPVINVNWDDARQYVAWLSKMTGQPYRLLTEAEWEYAARAGTTTAYFWGDEIGKGNANCNGCGSKWDARQTSPVGSFKPNEFGLYDMAGNVVQWVQDCYNDDYKGAPIDGSAWTSGDCSLRCVRSGSWYFQPVYLRVAYRFRISPSFRGTSVGFRVGRTLNP